MSLLWSHQDLVRTPQPTPPSVVEPLEAVDGQRTASRPRAQPARARRYRLRAWTKLSWEEVAARSESPSANAALLSARRHARRYRLPWPPRRVSDLTLGARAYWHYARTRLSWEEVAEVEDGRSAENVRGCARNYARKASQPWPIQRMADTVQRMYDDYASGGRTWAALAEQYGYTAASVARKAVQRHAGTRGLPWPPQLPAGPGVEAGDVLAHGSLQAAPEVV